MIFEQAILHWKNHAPWRDDVQVEQDLLLTVLLAEIYSDPFLLDHLAFRGGTCLNKLFWPKPTRYSEDLDFVQVKPGKIGPIVNALRQKLDSLFELEPHWETRRNGFRIYYRFSPEMRTGNTQQVKIEINTREHFSLEGYQQKELRFDSPWKSGAVNITTFSLHELLATKIRALYQRRKGRDLFDLWKSSSLAPHWEQVVPLFLEYMRREQNQIFENSFRENFQHKLKDSRFREDMTGLLSLEEDYDMEQAAQFVETEIISRLPQSKRKTKKGNVS